MHHRRAIMAGSYDPFQRGHAWLAKQALQLSDTVSVVISYNVDKKGMFNLDERTSLISTVLDIELPQRSDRDRISIEVVTEEILACYTKRTGATLLVRGLRNDLDFRYERDILDINRIAAPDIETVFMMPPSELTLASSSMVKGLLKFEGGIRIASQFAHPVVVNALLEKLNANC